MPTASWLATRHCCPASSPWSGLSPKCVLGWNRAYGVCSHATYQIYRGNAWMNCWHSRQKAINPGLTNCARCQCASVPRRWRGLLVKRKKCGNALYVPAKFELCRFYRSVMFSITFNDKRHGSHVRSMSISTTCSGNACAGKFSTLFRKGNWPGRLTGDDDH